MKNKRGEGVFGLSFSMIFSIILIIFFIIVAFIAIRAFLNMQKTMQISSFFDELQYNVDVAWNSDSSDFVFNYTLPSGVEYVCFVNLTEKTKNPNSYEEAI